MLLLQIWGGWGDTNNIGHEVLVLEPMSCSAYSIDLMPHGVPCVPRTKLRIPNAVIIVVDDAV